MEQIITTGLSLLASILSGVILYQMKENKTSEEQHRKERLEMEISERNMLLGVADLTILIGKKLNNRDSVNGELEESIKYLRDKKHRVQDLTREQYFEHRIEED